MTRLETLETIYKKIAAGAASEEERQLFFVQLAPILAELRLFSDWNERWWKDVSFHSFSTRQESAQAYRSEFVVAMAGILKSLRGN